ncbi:MAG: aminopeptidase P family protein, partial [Bosea sp. (in: a-proteobacteria)]
MRPQVAGRIAALRAELSRQELDGFVVPRADEHQGEYVPRCAERLAWLTGFTGSAGSACVLAKSAALIVDGRYTIQSHAQTDVAVVTPVKMEETPLTSWITANLPKGAVLGYDPWLHTTDGVRQLERAVKTAGGTLKAVANNPVDAIWPDRPKAPSAPVTLYPEALAGESASAKLARIADALKEARCDALVVSDPHALAWTFNIRGGDVAHTPLPLGYAVITREGPPKLLLDKAKLSAEVRATLAPLADIVEPSDLLAVLGALGQSGAKVRIDAASGASALGTQIEATGGSVDPGPDPIALMKARKNVVELAGARAAHLRDGAAMVRFLSWLSVEAPKGQLTEVDAVGALEQERIATGLLKEISFGSISAAGPNAALPHYRVSSASNRRIEQGIYLIDSGGQYEDGTTDITRTLAIGTPTLEMTNRNTLVLKGHIAISRAVFPKGVSGAQLDTLARMPLWGAGLDFDHGTGHGVGSYLSVHEGPQRLAKTGTTPLEPGMILSNEPGYYKPDAYGIRIENLIVVEPRQIARGEREMFGFETITWCPYDQALSDKNLLTADEIAWVNGY